MKGYLKKLLLILFALIIAASLISCDDINEFLGKIDGSGENENTEEAWDINTVYDQAKAFGYVGTLDEFLQLVNENIDVNKLNGIEITEYVINDNGHLILVFSNGTTIDAGKLTSSEANGVYKVTFVLGDGRTFEAYSKNYYIEEPETPTRENYIFEYWYLKKQASELDGEYEELTWNFDVYGVTSDITLYASWRHTSYTLQVTTTEDTVDLSGIEFTYPDYGYFGKSFTVTTDVNGYVSFVTDMYLNYSFNVNKDTLPDGYYLESIYRSENKFIATLKKSVEPKPTIGTGGTDEGNWWENIKYDETELVMAMTNCSNNKELSSGCERYLAGEGNSVGTSTIDQLVAQRNANAYELTKVNVTYTYYPDEASLYGFSQARNAIYYEIMSNNSATPDMYCNWMTDLFICSLKHCFANLYSRYYGEDDYEANNHFNLKNDGYMPTMESLTLSTQKLYVIASDYFIDLIRSFYVIPVNVTLFNSIAINMYPEVENPDINTFFDEIKPCNCTNYDSTTKCTDDCAAGGWTYDRLMQFSERIYQLNGTNNGESINGILGFALGANGLPAAGLIYSSSVTLINKEWNANANKYNYYYPTANQDLYDLFDKISDMMDTPGVYYATKADAESLNYDGEKTALLGIRNQFVNDKMLFGGIVLVGSLEYPEYQNMKTPEIGGFGVVPVPVYRAGDDYLTQIHVVGRAGAIRYNTSKFVQCSAFLHYQSSNSREIVDEYYEQTLIRGYDGNTYIEGNVEMLQYIRQNVRTAFDRMFDEAIYFLYEDVISDSANNRFHTLLANNGYQYYGMSNKYDELYSIKSSALTALEADYSKLPS